MISECSISFLRFSSLFIIHPFIWYFWNVSYVVVTVLPRLIMQILENQEDRQLQSNWHEIICDKCPNKVGYLGHTKEVSYQQMEKKSTE